ncbi:hypothetical protein MBLNU459_g4629t1 [Dothideomycetes sp. NU459]
MPDDENPAPNTTAPLQPLDSAARQPPSSTASVEVAEIDEFGLPVRKQPRRQYSDREEQEDGHTPGGSAPPPAEVEDAVPVKNVQQEDSSVLRDVSPDTNGSAHASPAATNHAPGENAAKTKTAQDDPSSADTNSDAPTDGLQAPPHAPATSTHVHDGARDAVIASTSATHHRGGASEWSHQPVASSAKDEEAMQDDDGEWQEMPAFATHTIYDDWGKVVAREVAELDEEDATYGHLGGAGKGYTKVQLDEDAQSATSMDEDTAYLFKSEAAQNTLDDDDEGRDILSQMQATKTLLTEGQRIAYVGLVRLSLIQMLKEVDDLERTKGAKKHLDTASEAIKMWSQKMMVRLYSHMEIDSAEQIMIEQLAEHGVIPEDLTPTLMQNARVKNPAAKENKEKEREASGATSSTAASSTTVSPRLPSTQNPEDASQSASLPPTPGAPPPYEEESPPDYLSVKNPSELGTSKNIDIDLRWTVLCDLFLVLIADSIYDARSRTSLERVGAALSVPWLDICRFEKRVTDALEMQEAADKENWNEDEHMQQRKKSARNRRLVMMGLATVGGGLVIGLSAGLLAPVIGAGLAAGFTTIGVAGTSSFLAGAGGAAIITSAGVLSGGTIAVRASNRRTGAVKTFEYRPLHNNKRVNLIITVAGWMTGKVDDVRLPFSTVDPIMGDIYSIFWEPEMLQSMGDTINILATEALTQGLQQILGSTILIALMAAIQLPVVLTKLAYLIDNPWSVSMARADMAGLIFADSLIDRNLGVRPVTLVGFSLGSRLIFSCLKELANRGAFGLVQNVYLFGTPVVAKTDEYLRAKSVVSGRFVNGYATNDWILGYLFRATSGGIMQVAGLAPVEIPGIENYNVTELVPGHMAYRKAMPKLMREVGWEVESDEFTEIEDPDPENHEKRQRELINEIEEARRALEKKPEKKGFKALFSRNKKLAEKREWEMYDEQSKAGPENGKGEGVVGANGAVLFDINAIQSEVAELAAQGIEIKEIKSTLPPMKLDVGKSDHPYGNLRQTRSFSGLPIRTNASSSSTALSNGSRSASGTAAHTPNGYDEYNEHEDSNFSMTFESPERSAKPSPHQLATNGSYRGSPTSSLPSPAFPDGRPTLHQSNTMPITSTSSNLNMGHNAWADDEDEFGKEKEMEMTFE